MAGRRFDPHRRDRIIDAALKVITAEGVAGTSHRKVAARADVPLGSMTYHFDSMSELLTEAFTRFSHEVVACFENRLRAARDVEEAIEAVVALIHDEVLNNDRNLVLTHELYTLAARVPSYREITRRWMARSRTALEWHFDPTTACQLDALIEGISIHTALDTRPTDRALTRQAVQKLCSTSTGSGNDPQGTLSP